PSAARPFGAESSGPSGSGGGTATSAGPDGCGPVDDGESVAVAPEVRASAGPLAAPCRAPAATGRRTSRPLRVVAAFGCSGGCSVIRSRGMTTTAVVPPYADLFSETCTL